MNLDIELPRVLADLLPRNAQGHPRVYPDVAPMEAANEMPYIVFTTVGGQSVSTLCGNNPVNSRIQFNVWARTRLEANRIMQAIGGIVTAPPLRAVAQGEAANEYDAITKDRGTRQDFSFWYKRTPS